MNHRDKIDIRGLKIRSRVGVPDEEREEAQDLSVDLVIRPAESLQQLADDIDRTIDYDQVAQAIRRMAAEGERHLIETLAEEMAEVVLGFAGVEEVEVEVRKYVLPDTDYVAVRMVCQKTENGS